MIPHEWKRLAQVDVALAAVKDACVREDNCKTRADSGHLSLLHSWWARRPLAACRALLLPLLLPDPGDSLCPQTSRSETLEIREDEGEYRT